ncbi:protein transport protein SEC24 B-like isoform X2 [Humulus lupulus]|uniref:protein transport protein SEC24 B-like isoform X2 n=1 Tax=Humulus lupulus TaxID=3486 RepID=UPI002B413FE0|nr:protein transport protein SEC24 B-like isoform X2 [Humulus lupulus]
MILLLFLEPLMLIVLDVQDVYTPLQTDVLVSLSEYRQHLELLLESIPTMFQNSKTAKSAFGAAIKAKIWLSCTITSIPGGMKKLISTSMIRSRQCETLTFSRISAW